MKALRFLALAAALVLLLADLAPSVEANATISPTSETSYMSTKRLGYFAATPTWSGANACTGYNVQMTQSASLPSNTLLLAIFTVKWTGSGDALTFSYTTTANANPATGVQAVVGQDGTLSIATNQASSSMVFKGIFEDNASAVRGANQIMRVGLLFQTDSTYTYLAFNGCVGIGVQDNSISNDTSNRAAQIFISGGLATDIYTVPTAPNAVATFTAAGHDARVDLAWTAPSSGTAPTSYLLNASPNGINSWTTLATLSSSNTSFIDWNAEARDSYYQHFYKIVPVASGLYGPETAVNNTTRPYGVSVTTTAVGTYPGTVSNYVNWTCVTSGGSCSGSGTGAYIYLNGTQIANLTDAAMGGIHSQLYTAHAGDTYVYGVLPWNAAGNASVIVNSTVTQRPAPPQGVVVNQDVGLAIVSWNASYGATSYKIYRNASVLASCACSNLTWTDSNAPAGGATYTVSASNAGGESAATGMGNPMAPTGLALSAGSGAISATWDPAPGPVTTILVYVGGTLNQTLGNVTSATISTYGATTNFCVYLVAQNGIGSSDPSSTVCAGGSPLAPAQVVGVIVTTSPNQVDLTWTPNTVPIVAGYIVLRDGAVLARVTQAAYTDTDVLGGSTYVYKVEAFDANGTVGPASEGALVTVQGGVLTGGAPGGGTAAAPPSADAGGSAAAGGSAGGGGNAFSDFAGQAGQDLQEGAALIPHPGIVQLIILLVGLLLLLMGIPPIAGAIGIPPLPVPVGVDLAGGVGFVLVFGVTTALGLSF